MIDTTADEVAELFVTRTGRPPTHVWSAPGRVNLIGEHTDYNGGLVLPFAIDLRTHAAARPRSDGRVRVWSREHPRDVVDLPLAALDESPRPGWAAYAVGPVAILRRRGLPTGGVDIVLAGDVPEGAGLSSSAALECAVAAAVADAHGLALANGAVADVAHRAENEVAGVPCGVMDQQVVMHAAAGTALLLDCATLRHEQIPFTPERAGLVTVVVDTRVRHALADGEYAARRRMCAAAADLLRVATLSEVELEELPRRLGELPEDLRGLCRHVVTENARVRATARLLRDGDVAAVGEVLVASHRSLREDFRVSCPELDLAVDALLDAGARGARLTGAGFGGSVVGLMSAESTDDVRRTLAAAFRAAGWRDPVVRVVRPSEGARRERTTSGEPRG